jgi:basic membrane lipoprotein Med (substrate-binding protein (PBP1-ABC) superfamily)
MVSLSTEKIKAIAEIKLLMNPDIKTTPASVKRIKKIILDNSLSIEEIQFSNFLDIKTRYRTAAYIEGILAGYNNAEEQMSYQKTTGKDDITIEYAVGFVAGMNAVIDMYRRNL